MYKILTFQQIGISTKIRVKFLFVEIPLVLDNANPVILACKATVLTQITVILVLTPSGGLFYLPFA